jgi:septal ring factor EnvC (AmiA/AmiB activator)
MIRSEFTNILGRQRSDVKLNFHCRKSVEKKRKEVEAKEQKMGELNQQLNKRKEQMDQLEKSLQKAGGTTAATTELSKKLADCQMQLEA